MAPVLRFEGVAVRAGGKTLLGPVTCRLDSPGITAVMGPNGAGKSLFLSAAHGVLDDLAGRVTWDDTDATHSRKSRGFMFQATPVLRRSVWGNIAFALSGQRLAKDDRAARITRALADARLDADPRKPAAALSGGERKRLDLARALVTDPRVLILDEPAANLDPAATAAFEDSLRRISGRGVKILFSTHDIGQAKRLADDILFIDGGQLIEQKTADTFFSKPVSGPAERFLKGLL